MVDGWQRFGLLIYPLFVIIIPLTLVIKSNYIFSVNKQILFFLFSYVILSMISAMFNGDSGLIFTSVLMMLLYLSLTVLAPAIIKNYNALVVRLIVLVITPIIIVPLLLYGITSQPYKGLFYNPNAFGITIATITVIIISVFISDFEKYVSKESFSRFPKFKLLILVSLLVSCFGFLALSGSRSSFTATVIVLFLGFSLMVFSLAKKKKIGNLLVKIPIISFFLFLISMGVIKLTNIGIYFESYIFSKFRNHVVSGDISNGRSYIWETTIKEAGLFGKGSGYFEETFSTGPHNTFISILGTNGWLPLVCFILITVISLYLSVRYFNVGITDKYRYLPVLSVISFILLSIGEGMLYKLSMLLMFATVGIAVNNSTIKIVNR